MSATTLHTVQPTGDHSMFGIIKHWLLFPSPWEKFTLLLLDPSGNIWMVQVCVAHGPNNGCFPWDINGNAVESR